MKFGELSGRQKTLWTFLLLSYTLQGVLLGINGSLIPIMKEAPSLELQLLLSYVSIGHTVKGFISPFCEFYYSKRIGKRKTYVLLSQFCILLNCLCIYWLQPSLPQLILSFILNGIFNGLMDVALDSWAAAAFKGSIFATSCQTFGIELGVTLGSQLFTRMNLQPFWQYFGYESCPILPSDFMLGTGLLVLFIFTICLLGVEEDPGQGDQLNDLAVMKSQLGQLFSRDGILASMLLFLVLSRVGVYWSTPFIIELKKADVDFNFLSTIDLVLLPLAILVKVYVFSRIPIQDQEVWAMSLANKVSIATSAFCMLFFRLWGSEALPYLAVLGSVVQAPASSVRFTCILSLVMRSVTAMKLTNTGFLITILIAMINFSGTLMQNCYTLLYNSAGIQACFVAGVLAETLAFLLLQGWAQRRHEQFLKQIKSE